MHHYVQSRFKIDDAVGAVAMHGYAGVFSVVAAGFLLWGYPAAAPTGDINPGWFGNNADGFAIINPLGQVIGAFIFFVVFGMLPGYIGAKILQSFGVLRVPREVELAGQDTHFLGDGYPYFEITEGEFEAIEREYAKEQ